MKYIFINFLVLLISLTYANNMGLIITFGMFIFLLLQMLENHKLVLDLSLKNTSIESFYQDTIGNIYLKFKKPLSKNQITNLQLTLQLKNHNCVEKRIYLQNPQILDSDTISYSINNLIRGRYQIKDFIINISAKKHYFYVWRYEDVCKQFYIYPKKLQDQNLIQYSLNELANNEGTDFDRHIPYTKGLNSKRIDWKVFARKDQVLWKKHIEVNEENIHINIDKIPGTFDEKLQKISFLLTSLYKSQKSWSLTLKSKKISASSGYTHLINSLEAISVL